MSKLRRMFPEPWVWARAVKLFYSPRSHLVQSGYVESIRRRHPCRADGSPIPWMNASIVFFLEQRLASSHTLFEYGSGYSTSFYAGRVHSVTSVEHDRGWYEQVLERKPHNVTLLHVALDDGESYCRAIQDTGAHYDIVIVDGRERERCMLAALDRLTPAGVILLDDSQRTRYRAAQETVRERGFRRLDFLGLKAGGLSPHQTSVFYRDGNCLGI